MTEEMTNENQQDNSQTTDEQNLDTNLGDVSQTEDNQDNNNLQNQEKQQDDNQEFFGKPEAYDYKDVKLPENMKLDEAMTGKFNEYAAKLNLSQKGADSLMAMAVELTQQTQKNTVEALGKLQEAKREEYRQLLNSDKEVGGAKLKESIAIANLAYDTFFKDEDLRVLIAEGGLNLHPKFIKALKTIGSQMKEDTIHSSNNPAGEKKSREEVMYPSMFKDKE